MGVAVDHMVAAAAAVEEVVAVDVGVVITAIKMATLPENAPNKDRSATRLKPLPLSDCCGSFMINASSLSSTLQRIIPSVLYYVYPAHFTNVFFVKILAITWLLS